MNTKISMILKWYILPFFFFSWDLQHGKTAGHKTKALQTVFGNNEKWLHWTSAASTQRNQDLNPKEAHWVCEVLWKLNEIMEQNLKNISNILKNKKKQTGNEAKIHHNTDNGQKRKNDNNTETTMLRFAFQTIQLLCCLFLFRMEEQADIFLNLLKV